MAIHCLRLPSRTAMYDMRYHFRRAAMKLEITTIGNSADVILPRDLLARLRLEKGDELFALETPDGIRLTTYDPTLAKQMEVACTGNHHTDRSRKISRYPDPRCR